MTDCTDSDKNHTCDVCGKTVGVHEAANGSHNCGYCGKAISSCTDNDKNHACDICSKTMGLHEANNGHFCSYCGEIASECVDNDKNHSCDICFVLLSTHEATVGSHNCGYCGKAISSCTDIDKNHACDICSKTMGLHEADPESGKCAYCGQVLRTPISVSGSKFDTAFGLEFSTTLSATTAIPAGRVFTLRYDSALVSYISMSSEFVSVQTIGNQLVMTALKDISLNTAFATLTFKTADDLAAGTYNFLFVNTSEDVTGDFAQMVIYQLGDVNMDGTINSRDALMIKQAVVMMVELTDVQKVYADVYADGNGDINSRDAMLLQQFIVHLDIVLGGKVQ